MPPKPKITREHIISSALDITRKHGVDALNARAIAATLNCSTQPIFSNYSSMEELKTDVIKQAALLYEQYLKQDMTNPDYPPYKGSGMGYIRFAKEEKELFKLLFMRDRSKEEIKKEMEGIDDLIELISSNTGLNREEAYMFHLEMWIFVHGIASMIATSYLELDQSTISRLLSDAYQGTAALYQNRKKQSVKKEDTEWTPL